MDTIKNVIQNGYQIINKLSQNYFLNEGDIDKQQYWSNQFQQEFIRHSTAEEIILLPQYEKYDITNQNEHDHQQMKNLLFLLETTTITDPQYHLTFDRLIQKFHKHIQHELNVNLPKLEEVLTSDQNSTLAHEFQETKYSSQLKAYPTSSINPPL
ncbi:hypothetical protein I4U23_027109 [Adineta vaga]|nr:hypothetical protein I4U23_027109 [Adineta vaga]